MTQEIQQQLEELYDYDIPPYVVDAGKSFITIHTQSEPTKITIKDVARYFATQACNIVSGMRSLAGIHGDWRQIDQLAHECLEWFKCVNIKAMRAEGRKLGIEAKF